jgi:hypothetical protein
VNLCKFPPKKYKKNNANSLKNKKKIRKFTFFKGIHLFVASFLSLLPRRQRFQWFPISVNLFFVLSGSLLLVLFGFVCSTFSRRRVFSLSSPSSCSSHHISFSN